MAYKRESPPKAKMHPIFHVSRLKLKLGHNITPIPTLPPTDCDGQLSHELRLFYRKMTKQLQTQAFTEVLVQWHDFSLKNATWKSLYNLQLQFPHLVGKVL